MKSLTLNFPDNFELDDKETVTFLASKLYEKGSLTLGQAAELAGYSKREFMEVLGRYGVSIFNYEPEDMDREKKKITEKKRKLLSEDIKEAKRDIETGNYVTGDFNEIMRAIDDEVKSDKKI